MDVKGKAQNSGKKPKLQKLKKKLEGLSTLGTVLVSIALIALVSVLIVGGYFSIYMLAYVNGKPKVDVADFKANQDQTTIIYANDANEQLIELARLHGEQNRVWVNLDEIPVTLQNAYIALEDRRFRKHDGVDWVRTVGVIVKPSNKGQGGSTITQQLIKNLTGSNEEAINRKFFEILNALNLEKNVSKATILEGYLNTVYLNRGCYGVKTGAEKYFGKELGELNLAECASLAAITQNPSKYDPLRHPEENKKRQLTCLYWMNKEKLITDEEYEAAKVCPLVFTNSKNYVPQGGASSDKVVTNDSEIQSYYVDFIIEQLIADFMDKYDLTKREASDRVYSGGLRVYAAVDLKVQKAMEDIYVNRKGFPPYSKSLPDAQSAMTVMDYQGRVIGIVGGAGKKTENRGLNRASSAFRQPGSSIKPLTIYGPAMEGKLINWSMKVQNYALVRNGQLWPKNVDDTHGSPNSYVTVQYALAKSLNTVPARLLQMIGYDASYDTLIDKFHLSHIVPEDRNDSSLAVGGTRYGVSTLEMASAFASFGNGGKYFKPYSYYKVTNNNGMEVYFQNGNAKGTQTFSVDTADVMNKLLQTVVTDSSVGTGRKFGVSGFQTFAKTGSTTSKMDQWFVGGTPYYVAAVWYGCDIPKELTNLSGNPSGAIFQRVMNEIHKGLPKKDFQLHSPLVVEKAYCTRTGLIAGPHCPKAMGWYSQTNMPSTCTSCTYRPPADEPEAGTDAEPVTKTPETSVTPAA